MGRDYKKLLSRADLVQLKHWIRRVKRGKGDSRKRKEFISDFPYKYIGKGKSRMVFRINKHFVIKVATTARGLRHNKREIDIYRSSIRSIKKHLGKIVIHGGNGWLIMQRLNKEIRKSRRLKKQLSKIIRKFREEGIKPRDTKRENLRRSRKGRIIFIDYGRFSKRS